MIRLSLFILFAVLSGFAASTQASARDLAAFKDDMFAYPALLSQSADGAYRVYDYKEARDINARDEVPERRVKPDYVSPSVRRKEADLVLKADGLEVAYIATGTQRGARVITIYLHGQGGNRRQGSNDYTFGGNFNRIRNLMVASDGLYLTPDFPDFGDAGAQHVKALMMHYSATSPRAPIILACGSMGGQLCWRLATDKDVAARLGGLLLLGSMWDDSFLKSAAFARRVPVFFSHGSRDKVFPVERQEAFFEAIRKAIPDYPARFARFETGTHGTPIRMTDWRETLNWMLASQSQ